MSVCCLKVQKHASRCFIMQVTANKLDHPAWPVQSTKKFSMRSKSSTPTTTTPSRIRKHAPVCSRTRSAIHLAFASAASFAAVAGGDADADAASAAVLPLRELFVLCRRCYHCFTAADDATAPCPQVATRAAVVAANLAVQRRNYLSLQREVLSRRRCADSAS